MTGHRILIGTAGWGVPRSFTGELPSTGTHLERYGCGFRCCEINTSFYRPHRAATWQRWADSVPEDFRFAVKAPRSITHEAKLAGSGEALKGFLDQARILGTKLGPVLFQLPPKLNFEPAVAEDFLHLAVVKIE